MKSADEVKKTLPDFYLEKSWKPLLVLLIGLLLTAVSIYYTRTYIGKNAIQEFEYACIDLRGQMEDRLRAHAHLLRSGAAYFSVTDTVTRESWNRFYEHLQVERHLPGIQGFGYSMIIFPHELEDHIRQVRNSGFPDYTVTPSGERELYTSIIYLEPFSGRNLRAFGYDMFSEPVRRKAMETARDSNYSVLSGKVRLVQETDIDIQPGALKYIPVFRQGMPVETVDQRRAAIKGWVYSPYRINDLTSGILGNWDLPGRNRIHLRIYDQEGSYDDSLLYDSQAEQHEHEHPNLSVTLPVQFTDREWMMVFTRNSEQLTLFHGDLMVVTVSGIIISILMFLLTSALIKTHRNAKHITELNLQLEKSNADKDRFISILGHDLRNPFNSILGYLEILISDFDTLERGKIEVFIKRINSASQATYNLLEDLLNWSRARAGTISFNPEIHNLNDLFTYIKRNMITQARAKDIRLNCAVNPNIMVFADIEMLKTIMRNLCSNAIKFTGERGEINITAEEDPGQVTITVADNGIGIKPEILQSLFTVSQPLTTSGTVNEPGSGMGLILCKEFVSIHGGQIRAESQPGKGSRFIVTLPRASGKAGKREKTAGKFSSDRVSS
jgi:signal transduction histidine kinase